MSHSIEGCSNLWRDPHGDDAHERPEQDGGAPRGQLRAQLAEHAEEYVVVCAIRRRPRRHTRALLGALLGAAGRGGKTPDATVPLPQSVRL